MRVVRVGAEHAFVQLGYVGKVLVLGGRDAGGVEVNSAFLKRILGEIARNHVIGFAIDRADIERHCGKLVGRAALHEKHVVVVGNSHKLAQKRLDLGVDFFVRLGAVAHFHNGHAAAVVIGQPRPNAI